MSTCADVGSFIESKTSVVQTLNVGFTSEVADYLVVHAGPGVIVLDRSAVYGVLSFLSAWRWVRPTDLQVCGQTLSGYFVLRDTPAHRPSQLSPVSVMIDYQDLALRWCCRKVSVTINGFTCRCFRHMQVPGLNFKIKCTAVGVGQSSVI